MIIDRETKNKIRQRLNYVSIEIGTGYGNQKTFLSPDEIDEILKIVEDELNG